MIKVELSIDQYGSLEISPASDRLRRRYERKILAAHKAQVPAMHEAGSRQATEEWLEGQAIIYVQGEADREGIFEDLMLKPAQRREIEEGYGLKIKVQREWFNDLFYALNPDVPRED